jgi:catechol 2,3-dioxygenase-like lactoylglutathione lyase family enzyme
MIAKRAHHVSLVVSDIEQARSFYGELLGLEEIERPDFGLPGAWYAAGDVELHLIAPPGAAARRSPGSSPNPLRGHVAFEVEDYEAVRDVLHQRGLDVLETGAEVGQLFVHDPDCNVVELIVPGGRLGRRR